MRTNEDIKANKKVKDSLFRFLFGENEENAISLYNAINGTLYTTKDGFEYTTLEDVVYMKMKNDVSFVLDVNLNLYGKKLIKIPVPKYIVFYNGSENDMEEERIELRLSDAFETKEHKEGYEWTKRLKRPLMKES